MPEISGITYIFSSMVDLSLMKNILARYICINVSMWPDAMFLQSPLNGDQATSITLHN